MKLIITGGQGQLGQSIKGIMNALQIEESKFIDIEDLDLTDEEAVATFFEENGCDVLINCAAYTAVDKAESEPEKAEAINVKAVENIARASQKNGFKIIHISTDYVFNGEQERAYKENDEPDPQTIYGKTKLEGEKGLMDINPQSVIIRTAWLYSGFGKNFFLTMSKKAKEGERVKVVDDQKGSPTFAGDLAKAILTITEHEEWHPGIYHYSNLGETTWYDFTKEIYKLCGADCNLVDRIKTKDFKCAAKRPLYSLLDKSKIHNTYGIEIPDWKTSLQKVVELSV